MTFWRQWQAVEPQRAPFATEAEAEAHRMALVLRGVTQAVVFEADDEGMGG